MKSLLCIASLVVALGIHLGHSQPVARLVGQMDDGACVGFDGHSAYHRYVHCPEPGQFHPYTTEYAIPSARLVSKMTDGRCVGYDGDRYDLVYIRCNLERWPPLSDHNICERTCYQKFNDHAYLTYSYNNADHLCLCKNAPVQNG